VSIVCYLPACHPPLFSNSQSQLCYTYSDCLCTLLCWTVDSLLELFMVCHTWDWKPQRMHGVGSHHQSVLFQWTKCLNCSNKPLNRVSDCCLGMQRLQSIHLVSVCVCLYTSVLLTSNTNRRYCYCDSLCLCVCILFLWKRVALSLVLILHSICMFLCDFLLFLKHSLLFLLPDWLWSYCTVPMVCCDWL
jgi:hypothetical protein